MNKRLFFSQICLVASVLITILFLQGCTSVGQRKQNSQIIDDKTFVDNIGHKITIDKPYERIITLYSAHTENLYTIGAGEQIIGVSNTSIYPPEVATLSVYDYRSDPEPLIAAAPDLVIIRPFINRNYPDFVRALEKSNIAVVSLYPDSWEEFETYTAILGMLTGREEASTDALIALKSRIEAIKQKTDQVPTQDRKSVFFESTKTNYRTVTIDSNPARAIAYAGGINIAADVKPITKGSTIAEFGIEKLMMRAEEIDVYISQRGAMNAGGSMISIPQREGFGAIKAVRNNAILEINEKLISSPTFRYDKGIREVARKLYPELMDDLSGFDSDYPLTREDYAYITVMANHTPVFVPSSSHYYEKEHKVHAYGLFTDVSWEEDSFDYIETAVLNSYIQGYRDNQNREYFDKEGYVTKEDIAYTLYIMLDVKSADSNRDVKDINDCKNPKIVQKIIDNNLMSLDSDGLFNPRQTVTKTEAIHYLIKGLEVGS